jgi:hypothetical protein
MLEIKGKKLAFGLAGFYDHVKDASGQDPLEWMNGMINRFKKNEEGKWEVVSILDEVAVYAYAGINLQLDIDEQENVSLDKVRKWCRTLTFEECGKIINETIKSLIVDVPKESGEPVSQPVS